MKPVAVSLLLHGLASSPGRNLPAHYVNTVRYTVKAYGELPENAKINETETFGDEEGECTFEFGDEDEVDIDDI